MAERKLRAVTAADAPKAKPKTLAEAVEGEDYLDILIAQRREMVRDVRDEKGPAKAALHRQIALHSKEIAALQAAAKEEADEDADATSADEAYDPEAV